MITKNEIKFIKSLQQKKYRNQHKCFIVEGEKMINELVGSGFKVRSIFAEKNWKPAIIQENINIQIINSSELKSISSLITTNKVLAVAEQPVNDLDLENLENKLSLVFDRIKDPGNLGTIIRIADWFGIEHIICSEDSVEVYNPKVVQATMGSLFRVKIHYTELNSFLKDVKNRTNLKVYGTLLNGENIYTKRLQTEGLIIMGNESEGISNDLIPFIDEKLLIPNFSKDKSKTESLNVAIATAIVCSEFKR